jgi:hypothetical protein
MVAQSHRLNARSVATTTRPGRHADGDNLYLNITATGARSWVFIYKLAGRKHEKGLGSTRKVSLAQAREKAAEHRQALGAGKDPMSVRKIPTFGECADQFIDTMQSAWRNEKHRGQ